MLEQRFHELDANKDAMLSASECPLSFVNPEHGDSLAAPFWRQWLNLNPVGLAFTDCVGNKVPFFRGGADVIDHLEVIDSSLYVEICGQLTCEARKLTLGQSIRTVAFTD
jgi:hypothetical protein